MNKQDLITSLLIKNNLPIIAIENKDFGTVIRSINVDALERIRTEVLERDDKNPISCHREYESSEAFMIIWNK